MAVEGHLKVHLGNMRLKTQKEVSVESKGPQKSHLKGTWFRLQTIMGSLLRPLSLMSCTLSPVTLSQLHQTSSSPHQPDQVSFFPKARAKERVAKSDLYSKEPCHLTKALAEAPQSFHFTIRAGLGIGLMMPPEC